MVWNVLRLVTALVCLATAFVDVYAYIPAFATNSTSEAINGGLNVSDTSVLEIKWYSNSSVSSFLETVSYQLAGKDTAGVSKVTKGVLVHFSEDLAVGTTLPTATPWVAFISCDRNSTNSSMAQDIFTLAQSKGAVSALLYSLTSVACILNRDYIAGNASSLRPFDIFNSKSTTDSRLLDLQFDQLSPLNASNSLISYDPGRLDQYAKDISQSIAAGTPVSPGYLLCALYAYNATKSLSAPTPSAAPSTKPSSNFALPLTKVEHQNIAYLTVLSLLLGIF